MKGIESLTEAVKRDCNRGEECFNANGCDKECTKIIPETNPRLIEMGVTEKCVRVVKCGHQYCNKYKWVLDRAELYAKLTKKTKEDVIKAWEEKRNYWYMNFYQECNQPDINGDVKVLMIEDWIRQLKEKFGKDPNGWKFKCPSCGGVQSGQDFIDGGITEFDRKVYFDCIGRHVKGKGCNWTLGGLIAIHKTVVVKDLVITPVFEMADIHQNKKHQK